MKLNTIIALSAIAAALVGGCRYDKSNEGVDEAATNPDALAGGVSDVNTDEVPFDEANSPEAQAGKQAGSLDELTGERRFEDIYTPCPDEQFAPVYFGLDSTLIMEGEVGKVDAVARHLLDNDSRVVVIEGNCDERGSNEYNMSLGESRAVIARNYLVENGVAPDRIQTRSYGEERPAVEGSGEAVWSRNRRDEFVIFKK